MDGWINKMQINRIVSIQNGKQIKGQINRRAFNLINIKRI